jgi:hypothetical protein
MKKVIAIFAIATLVACGGGSNEAPKTDSTAVAVDSTVVDTVAAPVVDTTATK